MSHPRVPSPAVSAHPPPTPGAGPPSPSPDGIIRHRPAKQRPKWFVPGIVTLGVVLNLLVLWAYACVPEDEPDLIQVPTTTTCPEPPGTDLAPSTTEDLIRIC